MNLLDQAELAENERLHAAGCAYAGHFCGVEMWSVPGQDGHVSRSEALAWLKRDEQPDPLEAVRATLQDALDFLGVEGVVAPEFATQRDRVCARLRRALAWLARREGEQRP